MKKLLVSIFILFITPYITFAIEDCNNYQLKINSLKNDIQGLFIQIGQAQDFIETHNSGNMNTGVLVQEYRESLYNKIALKEKEIEAMKTTYDLCLITNDKERLIQKTEREKIAQVDVNKIQEIDIYYAQKAKEDTIRLQIQIEANKKKNKLEDAKKARLAKVEANKKRLAEIRKKNQEKMTKNKK